MGQLMYGGREDTRYFGDLWALDLDAERWDQLAPPPGPAPSPRDHHTAAHHTGRMFVFGGCAPLQA